MLYNPQTPLPPQVRHRCRNPRCGTALKVQADNPRDAFCCKGCERSFYNFHCLVCEQLLNKKSRRREICWRSRCRHELQRHPEKYRLHASKTVAGTPTAGLGHNALKTSAKSTLKTGYQIRSRVPHCGRSRGRSPPDQPPGRSRHAAPGEHRSRADPAHHGAGQRRRRRPIPQRTAHQPSTHPRRHRGRPNRSATASTSRISYDEPRPYRPDAGSEDHPQGEKVMRIGQWNAGTGEAFDIRGVPLGRFSTHEEAEKAMWAARLPSEFWYPDRNCADPVVTAAQRLGHRPQRTSAAEMEVQVCCRPDRPNTARDHTRALHSV